MSKKKKCFGCGNMLTELDSQENACNACNRIRSFYSTYQGCTITKIREALNKHNDIAFRLKLLVENSDLTITELTKLYNKENSNVKNGH